MTGWCPNLDSGNCFPISSIKVIESITHSGFFGVGVSQQDTELRLMRILEGIFVFQNPIVVQEQLLILDLCVLRNQNLLTGYLAGSSSFSTNDGSKTLTIKSLRSYRLGWTERKLGYLLLGWPEKWSWRCYIHSRTLHVTSGCSSTVKENYRDLPGRSLSKSLAITSALDSNPRSLFVSEGFLRII